MAVPVTISGSLYNAQGTVVTTGILDVILQQDMVLDGQKILPTKISTNLSLTGGAISLALYPTAGAQPTGLAYFVEFDPDPSDVSKPRHAKTGYWSNYWQVAATPLTQALGSFPVSSRTSPNYTYMAATDWARGYNGDLRVVSANTTLTVADKGAYVYISGATVRTITLPQPEAGLHFTIAAGANAAHVITPTGTSKFNGLGLSKTNGQSLTSAAAAGNFVHLMAANTTDWYILDSRGSWS